MPTPPSQTSNVSVPPESIYSPQTSDAGNTESTIATQSECIPVTIYKGVCFSFSGSINSRRLAEPRDKPFERTKIKLDTPIRLEYFAQSAD